MPEKEPNTSDVSPKKTALRKKRKHAKKTVGDLAVDYDKNVV